jgi:hypothetical protein
MEALALRMRTLQRAASSVRIFSAHPDRGRILKDADSVPVLYLLLCPMEKKGISLYSNSVRQFSYHMTVDFIVRKFPNQQ